MRSMWLLLVVALWLAVPAAWAAGRSPADLIPAEANVYAELNLSALGGDAAGATALQQAFGFSKLMDLARQSMAKTPEATQELERVFSMVTNSGKALGWRVGAGIFVDPAALSGGGAPDVFVVANLADAAACNEALKALQASFPKALPAARAEGDLKVIDIVDGRAVLAQGKDWLALVFPADALSEVTKLATGESKASLAADPAFQQTMAVVPAEAVFKEYTSAKLVEQLATLASMAMPEATWPEPPKRGTAWALSLRVEEVQGRRLLKATWQTDLDTAAFLVQGPLIGAVAPAIARSRESARKTQCLSNVKNLALAMNMYLADYDAFPPADQWTTALEDYVKNEAVFKCPSDPSDAKCSYGMNAGLTAKPVSAIEDLARAVAIYETAHPGDCPRGGKDDLVLPGRHLGGNNFGFVDGHAKWVPDGQVTAEGAEDMMTW